MRYGFLLLGVLAAAVVNAETYKWVDKNGVVHYSDRPAPGAERVEITETQTYTPATPPVPTRPGAKDGAAPEFQYREIDVLRPKRDETLRNTGNVVEVRVRVDPELRPSHSIWLYLDGRRVDDLPTRGDSFRLTEVWRGTHTLTAVVTDNTGKTLVSSQPVTFHMHQTNLLSPRPPTAPPKKPGN